MAYSTPPSTQKKAIVRYEVPEGEDAALAPQIHDYFVRSMTDIINNVNALGRASPEAYNLSFAFLRGAQELFRVHGGILEQLPNSLLPADTATVAAVRDVCKKNGLSAQAAQKVVTTLFGTPSEYGATKLLFNRNTDSDFVVQEDKDLSERVKPITMPLGPDFSRGKAWCMETKIRFVEALMGSQYLPTAALTVCGVKIDNTNARYQRFDQPIAIDIADLLFDILGGAGVHQLSEVVTELASSQSTGFDTIIEASQAMLRYTDSPVVSGFFGTMAWSGDLTIAGRNAVRETLGLVGAVSNWRKYQSFVLHLQQGTQPTAGIVLNKIGEGPWQTPELAVKTFICSELRGWDIDRINEHLNIARVFGKMAEKSRTMILTSPKGTRTRVKTIGSARMLAAIALFFQEVPDYKRTVNPIGAALFPHFEAFITQPQSNRNALNLPIRDIKTRGKIGGETRTLANVAQQVIDVCGYVDAEN